jgi:preprotein translocase subunit YajC
MIDGGGDAAGWSIFALLVVVLTILGGVGFFMYRIGRRERENFDPMLSDDYVGTLQHGTKQ